jgi:hypothetical protein
LWKRDKKIHGYKSVLEKTGKIGYDELEKEREKVCL